MSAPQNPYDPPPSPEYPQSAYGPPNPNQTPMLLGVGSLVCGCLGLLSCMPLFGCCVMPLPVLAIILGSIGLTQKPDQTAKILSIAGIAIGLLSILMWAAIFAFGMVNAAGNNPQFNAADGF